MRPTNRSLLRRVLELLERAEDRRVVVNDQEFLAGLPVHVTSTLHVIVTSRGDLATLLLDLRAELDAEPAGAL